MFMLANVHISLVLELCIEWNTCTIKFVFCSGNMVNEGIGVLVQPGFSLMCWLAFALLLCYTHSSPLVHLFFFYSTCTGVEEQYS